MSRLHLKQNMPTNTVPCGFNVKLFLVSKPAKPGAFRTQWAVGHGYAKGLTTSPTKEQDTRWCLIDDDHFASFCCCFRSFCSCSECFCGFVSLCVNFSGVILKLLQSFFVSLRSFSVIFGHFVSLYSHFQFLSGQHVLIWLIYCRWRSGGPPDTKSHWAGTHCIHALGELPALLRWKSSLARQWL